MNIATYKVIKGSGRLSELFDLPGVHEVLIKDNIISVEMTRDPVRFPTFVQDQFNGNLILERLETNER